MCLPVDVDDKADDEGQREYADCQSDQYYVANCTVQKHRQLQSRIIGD